jgi:hypothetical protein
MNWLDHVNEDIKRQMDEIAFKTKDYRDQTELAKSEIARKQNEEVAQKRRIEEKQIRSLRQNYRAQSLLGSGNTSMNDMTNKLGG